MLKQQIIKQIEKLDAEKTTILEQLWDEIFQYDAKDKDSIIELIQDLIK